MSQKGPSPKRQKRTVPKKTREMRKINRKRINRKKVLIFSSLFIAIILIILAISLYISQKSFRDWIDINILGKNLTEEDIQVINLNTDKNNQVHVYSKYIALLNDKNITLYNVYGEKEEEINLGINKGIFDSSDRYFVIAEELGNEICLIFDKTYLWSANAEGKIHQVYVNKNGYVAAVSEDVTHKSILTVYNSEGTKLFTSYFASTRIIDVSISKDNKNIVIGELDTTGTVIQSYVKIISVQNAQKDTENTITNTYNLDEEELITNVEFQEKGQISYVYDNGINVIKNEENKGIVKVDNDNITYFTIDLNNDIVYIEEEMSGLFKSNSNIHIVNTANDQDTIYRLEDVAKDIYTKGNTIAINAGTKLYFINTGGWLIKKYTAKQEITDVKFSDDLAALVYKDKIIIIDL